MSSKICGVRFRNPIIKDCNDFWIRVDSITDITNPTRNNGWILPNNSVYVLSHDGSKMVNISSGENSGSASNGMGVEIYNEITPPINTLTSPIVLGDLKPDCAYTVIANAIDGTMVSSIVNNCFRPGLWFPQESRYVELSALNSSVPALMSLFSKFIYKTPRPDRYQIVACDSPFAATVQYTFGGATPPIDIDHTGAPIALSMSVSTANVRGNITSPVQLALGTRAANFGATAQVRYQIQVFELPLTPSDQEVTT